MSKFYTFGQNNSGGSFVFDGGAGLSEWVIIEADSTDEANDLAERAGIYFNGCDDGFDCHCCGDRWSAFGSWGKPDDYPAIYGQPVEEHKNSYDWMNGNPSIFVHYKDGRIVPFKG